LSVAAFAVGGLLIGLSACGDDPAAPDPDPVDSVTITAEIVVQGLDAPLFLTAPEGDDRLFVVLRAGRIVIFQAGQLLPTPFLDLTSLVGTLDGERGLLGMAFHPSYATNGRFFVSYTDADDGSVEVVRYTVSANPNVTNAGTAHPILSVQQPFDTHNGGMLAFGPDGMLYIGMGDGGDVGDPLNHAQRPETLLGSILRIDVDGGSPYAVPADNPFVGHPTARPETWAYGLRNPWRFSFDRQTGDVYIADVGQGDREEVNYQSASSEGGENYGWNIMEGTACYDAPPGCPTSGLTPPVHDYAHDPECSVTGGYVYRGSALPNLVGRYVFADFCATWVRSFRIAGGVAEGLEDLADVVPIERISSFGEDGHAELYVVSLRGTVYKLVPETP